MRLLRWYAWWVAVAIIGGGLVGLAAIEPGGNPGSGAYEFGRAYLAPFVAGAGVATICALPIATVVAVVWFRRSPR